MAPGRFLAKFQKKRQGDSEGQWALSQGLQLYEGQELSTHPSGNSSNLSTQSAAGSCANDTKDRTDDRQTEVHGSSLSGSPGPVMETRTFTETVLPPYQEDPFTSRILDTRTYEAPAPAHQQPTSRSDSTALNAPTLNATSPTTSGFNRMRT